MQNGKLESALRSIIGHRDMLTPDSVILVVGNRITVKESDNVKFYDSHRAERMTVLPKNVWIVLSTRQRSHQLGDNLARLAASQHIHLPQYILPPNIIKQVIGMAMDWMRKSPATTQAEPQLVAAAATFASASATNGWISPQVVTTEYRPLAEKRRERMLRPKPLVMISYRKAKRLFREFFDQKQARRMSNFRMIIDLGLLLEAGDYNMTSADFGRLMDYFRSKNRPSAVPQHGRRRDRCGNLPRLRFRTTKLLT